MAFVNHSVGPMMVSSFLPLQSVTAALLSTLFLGEPLVMATLVGGVGVVSGLLITVGSRYFEALSPAAAAAAAAAATAADLDAAIGEAEEEATEEEADGDGSITMGELHYSSRGDGSNTMGANGDGSNAMGTGKRRGGLVPLQPVGSKRRHHHAPSPPAHSFGIDSFLSIPRGHQGGVPSRGRRSGGGSAEATVIDGAGHVDDGDSDGHDELGRRGGISSSVGGGGNGIGAIVGDGEGAYRSLRGASAEQNEFIRLLHGEGGGGVGRGAAATAAQQQRQNM